MSLSESLSQEFAKATSDKTESSGEYSAYGVVQTVNEDGTCDVVLDGGEDSVTCSTTVVVKAGDRVSVLIKNRQAVITGNATSHTINGDVLVNGNATFKGRVEAESGYFKGELQAATGSFKGDLDAATGSFKGDLDAAGGTFKGALSAATGSFKGSLSAATGSFKGDLDAAGGTFKGALSAATGSFKGDLDAAGGTFKGALSAATGSFKGDLDAAGGTFKGALSAATGSFKGSLSAASGTFKGDLDAAGGTFKGSLSAASGTFKGALSAATGSFSGQVKFTYKDSDGNSHVVCINEAAYGDPMYIYRTGSSYGKLESFFQAGYIELAQSSPVKTYAISSQGAHSSSDARLKEKITNIDAELPLNLRPVQFHFKGSDQVKYGFIAQEVSDSMPDAVSEGRNGYLMLDYQEFIAPTLALAQHNNKLIESLTKRVEELERKVEELETKHNQELPD